MNISKVMPNPNGDTPVQQETQKTPAAETDTPPKGPSSSPDEEKNEVERERARAATAQREADEARSAAREEKRKRIAAERELTKLRGGSGSGAGAGTDSDDGGQLSQSDASERQAAESGVMRLLVSTPEYQKLMEDDPTLKEVLLNSPLSLIREFIDSEDAIEQIQDKLNARLRAKADKAGKGGSDGTQAPVEHPPKPAGEAVEMKGSLTPGQVSQMTPDQWSKLSKEQREAFKRGEF